MKIILRIFFTLILFVYAFFIWAYKMLISNNIPINISLHEFILFICFILVYIFLQFLFINKNQINILNIILTTLIAIPWLITLQQALKYKYNTYDTAADIIGLISIVIVLAYTLYKLINNIRVRNC